MSCVLLVATEAQHAARWQAHARKRKKVDGNLFIYLSSKSEHTHSQLQGSAHVAAFLRLHKSSLVLEHIQGDLQTLDFQGTGTAIQAWLSKPGQASRSKQAPPSQTQNPRSETPDPQLQSFLIKCGSDLKVEGSYQTGDV